ncbi:hypothetical protein [Corynebacterium belfantii]|uniref:hypothetical protein n=1 Tax=Corynebacterium belfantii TaxID=2014537 RepID=UPI001F15D006|nr:hypothetical protein [Corynebacterium belfantii]
MAFAIGSMSMQFIVAALSGYIAFAIAGRSGIAPGFIGGPYQSSLAQDFWTD